jgi:hypothetical protein
VSWATTTAALVAAGVIAVLVILGRRRWREAESGAMARTTRVSGAVK